MHIDVLRVLTSRFKNSARLNLKGTAPHFYDNDGYSYEAVHAGRLYPRALAAESLTPLHDVWPEVQELPKNSSPAKQLKKAGSKVESKLPKTEGRPPGASNVQGTDPQEALALSPPTSIPATQPIHSVSLPTDSSPLTQLNEGRSEVTTSEVESAKTGGPPPGASDAQSTGPQESLPFPPPLPTPTPPVTNHVTTQPIHTGSSPKYSSPPSPVVQLNKPSSEVEPLIQLNEARSDVEPLIQLNEAKSGAESPQKTGGPARGTDSAFSSQEPAPQSKPKLTIVNKSKLTLKKYFKRIQKNLYQVLAWFNVAGYKIRMRFLRPATPEELQRYTEVRDQLSGLLATHQALKLNDKEVLDANTLAKRLDKKLSPPVNPYKSPPAKSEYKDYLARLESRYKLDYDLEDLRQRWTSQPIKLSQGLTSAEGVTENRLNIALSNLNRQNYLAEYDKRCRNVIQDLQPQLTQWQEQPKGYFPSTDSLQYFPSFYHDRNPRQPYWGKKFFVQARTAQLQLAQGAEFPLSPVKTPLTPLGELLRDTPSSIPLEELLHDWTIAEGFGAMLDSVSQAARTLLVNELQEPLSVALNKPLELEPFLKSIFASTSKEDIAWREKLFQDFYGSSATPSMLFEQLKGIPDEQVRLRSAFENHSGLLAFLDKADRKSLEQASSDPAKLAEALTWIESRSEAGSKVSEELQDFRNEALKPDYDVERPFVENLHKQGIIDQSTRQQLNPPGGLSRQKFLNALGTKEDFTRQLMTNLENDLLKTLAPSEGNPPGTVARTTEHLAQLHVEKLHKQAESEYFKPGLFQNPPKYEFLPALRVFDPQEVRKLAKLSDHKEMLFKAYIQARLPHFELPKVQYKSEMDKFLSQIKIPQPGAHPAARTDKRSVLHSLPNFDERLSVFYLEPLKAADARLDGTPYARLTDKSRRQLNALASEAYLRRHQLDQTPQLRLQWSADIAQFEKTHLRQIPVILQVMESFLRQAKAAS
ncbi:hypothetical protein PtA15_1A718 [Puccinia triticina]|uniref:Uncharacterized protein n=1 Tax=Puccinia triticina TaxID=208348 RepID=A0ABY7CBT7_9BASI|nr:uncharacterized protein PtA15_1A718 [Puccinia triticina]WAQ81377.1 hypothetical protein PtA15_1A718 [Puccinia triticina]